MRRYSKPKNEKLPPFATSTIRLFSSLISTRSFAISSRIRFSTAFISQSRRGWESINISRSSAKTCISDGGVFPALKFKLHHYSIVPEKWNTSSAHTELRRTSEEHTSELQSPMYL